MSSADPMLLFKAFLPGNHDMINNPIKLGCDENTDNEFNLIAVLASFKDQMTYLSHQVNSIKTALHIGGCECDVCKQAVENINSNNNVKTNDNKEEEKTCEENIVIKENNIDEKVQEVNDTEKNDDTFPDKDEEEILDTHNENDSSPNLLDLQDDGSDSGKRGRKSKYCNAETKIAVADYAKKFGPSAAARKFRIPPSVASYYYRKSFGKLDGAMKPSIEKTESFHVFDDATQAPSPPGVLRGRGRGRPKLIGDELDASLVEFMVNYKKTHGIKHMNTNDTLELAKQYIRTKSPGLLDDEGGPINLKHTWALKLQTRIAEREQENGEIVDNLNNNNNMNLSLDRQSFPLILINQLYQNHQMLEELSATLKNNENNNVNNNNNNIVNQTIPDEQNYQAVFDILNAFNKFQEA